MLSNGHHHHQQHICVQSLITVTFTVTAIQFIQRAQTSSEQKQNTAEKQKSTEILTAFGA